LHARKTYFKCDFFIICPRDICQMSKLMKISAKINTAKYQHFTFCSFTVLKELKERLIVVWSDFQQDIIDTVIDQCR